MNELLEYFNNDFLSLLFMFMAGYVFAIKWTPQTVREKILTGLLFGFGTYYVWFL